MNRMVTWAITNAPGMNVLMLALMLIGGISLANMRREVFPAFELEIVMVSVPYPGATPKDSEEAICQKIEEAIRSIDGIKKVTSIAQEGAGVVLAELRSDVRGCAKGDVGNRPRSRSHSQFSRPGRRSADSTNHLSRSGHSDRHRRSAMIDRGEAN